MNAFNGSRKTKENPMNTKSRTTTFAAFALILLAVVVPAYAGGPAANNGTSLTVLLDAAEVTCNEQGSGASVSVHYTVVSTGSADSAVMTATIGSTSYALPTIASGNVNGGGGWTMSGRTKTAEGTFSTALPNGTYIVSICANQSTNPGRESKISCSEATIVVNCVSPSACANVGPFGEVPHNKNLCAGNGHGNIEIQFRGDFGEVATLVIEGPNGFSLVVPVDRAGDSCNYHYNWNPAAGQAPGTYTFSVGSTEWTAALYCDAPGRP
jgi:hypothetical protein